MESGPLTEDQIADALEATHETRELRAVMSLIECFIAEAHAEMTQRGQEARIRDEKHLKSDGVSWSMTAGGRKWCAWNFDGGAVVR